MPAKKKIALFIGRFQPYHRGHLAATLHLLESGDYDQVVMAVGSSQESRTVENPFTVGERHAMIKAALEDEGYAYNKDFRVVPVPDVEDDDKYPAHVKELAGKFDVLVTGNDHVNDVFARKMKSVEIVKPKKKYAITGTMCREALGQGEDMEKYLHPEVVAFLQKIGAARKIIDIEAEARGEVVED